MSSALAGRFLTTVPPGKPATSILKQIPTLKTHQDHVTGNSTPRYNPQSTENIHPHKNQYAKVHSSVIYNSQKVDTTQVPLNLQWMSG